MFLFNTLTGTMISYIAYACLIAAPAARMGSVAVPSCLPHCSNELRLKNLEAQLAAFKREMANKDKENLKSLNELRKEVSELKIAKDTMQELGTAMKQKAPAASSSSSNAPPLPAPLTVSDVLVPPPPPTLEAVTVDAGAGTMKQAKRARAHPKGKGTDSANAAKQTQKQTQFQMLPSSSTYSSASSRAEAASAATQQRNEPPQMPVEPFDNELEPAVTAAKRSRKRKTSPVAGEIEIQPRPPAPAPGTREKKAHPHSGRGKQAERARKETPGSQATAVMSSASNQSPSCARAAARSATPNTPKQGRTNVKRGRRSPHKK